MPPAVSRRSVRRLGRGRGPGLGSVGLCGLGLGRVGRGRVGRPRRTAIRLALDRRDLRARRRPLDAAHHHAIAGRKAGFDHPVLADLLADGDDLLLDHVVLVHHQQIFALLRGADRRIGDEEGIGNLLGGNAHAHEKAGQ